MRIGRLQLVIQAPCDGKRTISKALWRSYRESAWRRAHQRITQAVHGGYSGRHIVDAAEPRSAIGAFRARGVSNARGQAECSILVEGVHDPFAEVVIVLAVPGADGSLPWATEQLLPEARRVGDGEARRKVGVIPIPVRLTAIRFSANIKGDGSIVSLAREHCSLPLAEPIMHA